MTIISLDTMEFWKTLKEVSDLERLNKVVSNPWWTLYVHMTGTSQELNVYSVVTNILNQETICVLYVMEQIEEQTFLSVPVIQGIMMMELMRIVNS